jgi:hypothetical protein
LLEFRNCVFGRDFDALRLLAEKIVDVEPGKRLIDFTVALSAFDLRWN